MSTTTEEITANCVTNIVRDLVDPDECWFDHHGYCQAHCWFGEGECPHARGKKWLANFAAALETTKES